MSDNQATKKQSKLGLFSFLIGILNILIIFILIQQVAQFFVTHPELIRNPAAIDGMRISKSTVASFMGIFLLQFLGFILGMISLFHREVKRLFPILGTVINGILATISTIKYIV